ncbi:MAG: FAD-dependent oxidoreductase [Betaproteobacteria bacterium]|nr:FAD-dependent oxidoreductase [Betaproteobacteria bacterium]MDE2047502.1 FAD-dependent oxidoreductase [Betaproteobacteria bacterium]
MKVAVIGSGIAGLGAAYALRDQADITLFEAGSHFGGHTHTVDITLGGRTWGVDTGFLVYNERTYPQLIALFDELGVTTAASDMSFSVKLDQPSLEWCGSNLNTVFAQRRNLLSPRFHRMLRELLRFNRTASSLAQADLNSTSFTVGEFLRYEGYSRDFIDWYFLPMIGCIWSCPTQQMMEFPLATMLRFCQNHGLLQVSGRPQWRTVVGGARQYVERITAHLRDKRLNTPVRRVVRQGGRVLVSTDAGTETFDHVVVATHSDQALALLGDPSSRERQLLGAIAYHPNRAVLHTDVSVLPRRRLAWASWNYEHSGPHQARQVCLHYLLNRLQPLPFEQPVIVSLNPVREPDAAHVIREIHYAHPVFDRAAIAAQHDIGEIQGIQNTWYCGAWCGYGFHEDGLKSGQRVAAQLKRWLAAAGSTPPAVPAAALPRDLSIAS